MSKEDVEEIQLTVFHPDIFGDLIRKKRKKQRITIREMASDLKMGECTLRRIEHGESHCTVRDFFRICKYLGLQFWDVAVKCCDDLF